MSTEPPQNGFRYWTMTSEDSKVDEAELFKAKGIYCHCCFSFSNDLRILSVPHKLPEGYTRADIPIHWKFRLANLKAAAEGGCQWCTFFATRFFGEFAAGFVYSKSDGQAINRCCRVGEPENGKLFVADMARIGRILDEHPDADFDFSIKPVDQLEDLSFGRLVFTPQQSNVGSEIACHALGNRHNLVIEVYATEGESGVYYVPVTVLTYKR